MGREGSRRGNFIGSGAGGEGFTLLGGFARGTVEAMVVART